MMRVLKQNPLGKIFQQAKYWKNERRTQWVDSQLSIMQKNESRSGSEGHRIALQCNKNYNSKDNCLSGWREKKEEKIARKIERIFHGRLTNVFGRTIRGCNKFRSAENKIDVRTLFFVRFWKFSYAECPSCHEMKVDCYRLPVLFLLPYQKYFTHWN